MPEQTEPIELSVILPCRNEEESLGGCLDKIRSVIGELGMTAEIIVSDSSTDKSPEIAIKHGARLIKHDRPGYGTAYLEGFKAAKGRLLFLADADSSYDFSEIPAFLSRLSQGSDLVIGNRFAKNMSSLAMPWANKYIGNPGLSFILRLISGSTVNDAHCGMRAITRRALDKMKLKSTGMEFASEMILEATRRGLSVSELPIEYYPRKGTSKLRPISDGLRHLRLLLQYAFALDDNENDVSNE